ncbi:ATP-binding protein [Amycolatopsis thailandensis]|uniref:ATP-binding protein n=1 Tax=Amycolatopsis thailandensis TaxID=589330 RepID=UPI003650FB54
MRVRAGKNTILAQSERTTAVDVVAELVWNAIDAEATAVDVTVIPDAADGPGNAVVADDGHGMPFDNIPSYFQTHGDSWKKARRFSEGIKRPLHGQLGRGRFLTYGIAEDVEWSTTVATESGFVTTVVHGSRNRPDEFSVSDPQPEEGPRGTTVTLTLRQIPRTVHLVDGDLLPPLTAQLAGSLLALPDVTVTYRGQRLDPKSHIIDEIELPVPVPAKALHGLATPVLRFVEWDEDMSARRLFLCDQHGAVVTDVKPTLSRPAPIHWSAYLIWEGFRDQDLMSAADLALPEIRHGDLLDAAQTVLNDHLGQLTNDRKGAILAEWKAQGVYPYAGSPSTPAEEVEREVFDIVAVLASQAIGKDRRQKELSLRLLQEAARAEPTRTGQMLTKVLTLSDDEQEMLVELLERTTFGSIVRSAHTLADRVDFLAGLRRLLYSDETRKTFREVDQLHPMLVQEPWIFGDEWSLSLSESGLSRVVRAATSDAEYAPTPVTLPSGKRGRVDMVFYRHLPESERNRHLVVELKRPMRATMKEFSQLNDYATAITGHPEVVGTSNEWDFWLITTDVNDAVRNLWSNTSQPGLVMTGPQYRLWIMTWGQLLERAERRLEAFRQSLDLVSTEGTSRAYLQRRHAEFIPESEKDRPAR